MNVGSFDGGEDDDHSNVDLMEILQILTMQDDLDSIWRHNLIEYKCASVSICCREVEMGSIYGSNRCLWSASRSMQLRATNVTVVFVYLECNRVA